MVRIGNHEKKKYSKEGDSKAFFFNQVLIALMAGKYHKIPDHRELVSGDGGAYIGGNFVY